MNLISEMKKCKTVADCYECATVDAKDEYEDALGWLACYTSG